MSEANREGAPVQDGVKRTGSVNEADLARIMDVKVEVSVELGRRRLSISEVLQLGPNSVLEFFKRADEPLDIRVGGRLVARGEAVIMADRYGVRVTEVVGPLDQRLQDENGGSP